MFKLTRRVKNSEITLGTLTGEGNLFSTVERPWLGNKRNISCIPDGEYTVKRVNSPKFGSRQWEITGVPNRSHILLHVANHPHDVEGCVGLGTNVWPDFTGVGNSRNAIEKFYAATNHLEEFVLTVVTETTP